MADWIAYLEADPKVEPYLSMAAAWKADKARLAEADREATVLVVAMADQFGAPDNWRPLPDVAGKITQISNMAYVLRSRLAEQVQTTARIASERACLEVENHKITARLAVAEALLREALPAVQSHIRKHQRAWEAAMKRGDDFHVRKHCEQVNNGLATESRIDAFLGKLAP